MADWNSELYLKFKAERTQPAHDLAARIPLRDARSILDIGCGPGNSTAAVAARYPGARVLGVDSSENMVAAACAAHPNLNFVCARHRRAWKHWAAALILYFPTRACSGSRSTGRCCPR